MFIKKILTVIASTTLLFSSVNAEETNFSSEDISKLSETFGHLIGHNLESPGFTFDVEAIITGIRKAVAGDEAPLSKEEYENMISAIQEKAFQDISDKNLADAEVFLLENISVEGVVEIEDSRLQYLIIEEGEGAVITESSAPRIHYTGELIDGTVFGSSLESEEPITLSLDQTIPGFQRGLIGMQKGEKRRLFIHPEMAYGTSGHLPPNSLLIFDIEIIDILEEQSDTLEENS